MITNGRSSQETIAYMEKALPEWQLARAKRDRAGGNNAEANLYFSSAAAYMDGLLEELFAQMVVLDHDKQPSF